MGNGLNPIDEVAWERLKTVQIEQLTTFKSVADFCDRNGLVYFADSGTLLGALRHSGFIPWDDDIDLVMPRPDYNRFFAMIAQNEELGGLNWLYNEDFRLSFGKVYRRNAVSDRLEFSPSAIDIFPLDGVPRSHLVKKFQSKIRAIFNYVLLFRAKKLKGRMKYMAGLISFILPLRKVDIKCLIERMSLNRSDWKPESLVGVRYLCYGARTFVPYSIYGVDAVRKVRFEDTQIRVPLEAEALLEQLYGNWKRLPPVEERLPRHTCDEGWFFSSMRMYL